MSDTPEEPKKLVWSKRVEGERGDLDPRNLPPELQAKFARIAAQFVRDGSVAGNAFKQATEANIEKAREIGIAARAQRKADTEEAFVNALRTVNTESVKSTLPASISDEIQAILSKPDLWDAEQSKVSPDYSFSQLCRDYVAKRVPSAVKAISMTAAALAPIIVGLISGTQTNWFGGLIGALAAVLFEAVVFLFFYLFFVPSRIWNDVAGDLKAARYQILEEKRKLQRVASLVIRHGDSSLVIDHRPDENTPYVMEGDMVTQYRISIFSSVQVDDVELVANHFNARPFPVLFDIPMRPMNDRTSGAKRVSLKPAKKMYWDIVSVLDRGPSGRCSVYLNCIPSYAAAIELNDPGEYEFELMATGGNRQPVTKIVSFQVTKDWHVSDFQLRDGRLSD